MTSTTIFFFFIPFLSLVLLAINLIFAPHNAYQEKNSVFECGYHSFLGQNRTQFSISFFIFALLFLLFDLEILLIYPYIVSSYTITIYGLVIMLIFFLVLTLGFQFELGKKALNIYSRQLNIIKYIYTLRVSQQSNIFFSTSSITSVFIVIMQKLNSLNLYLIIYTIVFITIICILIEITSWIIHHADNNEATSSASQDVNHAQANMAWKYLVRNRCKHEWIVYYHPITCKYAAAPTAIQCSQLNDINWICKLCYEIRCGTHAANHWPHNCGNGVYRSPSPPKEANILASLLDFLKINILLINKFYFILIKIVCIILLFMLYIIIFADTLYADAADGGYTANGDGTYTLHATHSGVFVSGVDFIPDPPYASNQPFATYLSNAMDYDDNCWRESKGWAPYTRPSPLNSSKYGADGQRFLDSYLQHKEPRGPNFIYKNTSILREALKRLP